MFTIKNKFLISFTDDLLDDLHGSHFFTKLDIHYGYQQIHMNKANIPKMDFHTHEGHYKFLVIPFGLFSAPSTFYRLTNHIFNPLLRYFVIFFFEDILVYNKTWVKNVLHMDWVLQLLYRHQLFLKNSKCCFSSFKVEYLGHIVGGEGVPIDPKKIEVVKDWPHPKTLKSLCGFLGFTGYYRKFV